MTFEITIPSRMQTIQEFTKNGGKIAVVFPIHYPRALLRAHNILPVETWGPTQADLSLSDIHLQSYTCSVVKHGLAYLLGGGFAMADLFLVPHCCDTLQGLGSILVDFIKPKQPTYPFYLPRERRAIDIDYFVRELRCLNSRLTEVSGLKPTGGDLLKAIETEEQAVECTKALFANRRELLCDNREFYQLIRSREYLPAEIFIKLGQQVLRGEKRKSRSKDIPIILSGVVPEPAQMFDTLTKMKTIVVADDSLCVGRRIYEKRYRQEPWARMAETIMFGPPDSTLGTSIEHRLSHLKNLVTANQAKGVIFYNIKFCEPEQFYLPALRKGLDSANIPSLTIEVELGDAVLNQVVTRLEAFVEMIS